MFIACVVCNKVQYNVKGENRKKEREQEEENAREEEQKRENYGMEKRNERES